MKGPRRKRLKQQAGLRQLTLLSERTQRYRFPKSRQKAQGERKQPKAVLAWKELTSGSRKADAKKDRIKIKVKGPSRK